MSRTSPARIRLRIECIWRGRVDDTDMLYKKRIAKAMFGVGMVGGFGMLVTDYYIYAPIFLGAMWVPAMWIWMSSD